MKKTELMDNFLNGEHYNLDGDLGMASKRVIKYVEWLEVRTEEIVRVLNAVCVLFDNGEREITVGERANLMIAKSLIEEYPQKWVE